MDGAVPIAVCRYLPDWYEGAVYQKVAPYYDMLAGMKNADTREYFSKKYLTEVLGSLEPGKVEKEIKDIVGYSSGTFAVLMCFEKPSGFCHRHLVTAWLGRDPDDAELKW